MYFCVCVGGVSPPIILECSWLGNIHVYISKGFPLWLWLTTYFIVIFKDLSFIPTTNEKTVTYRRDRPVEMNIHVHKLPLGDPWQC